MSTLQKLLVIIIVCFSLNVIANVSEKEKLKRVEYQNSFIGAKYLEIKDGKIVVSLTNLTGKDIDNIKGSWIINNKEGDYVTGKGLTYWADGLVFMRVGAGTNVYQWIEDINKDRQQALIDNAVDYQYIFTVSEIKFVGEEVLTLVP